MSQSNSRSFEAQGSSSQADEEHETDSGEEADPVNFNLDNSVLTDDPLGEQTNTP